jgi:hypothetical protein
MKNIRSWLKLLSSKLSAASADLFQLGKSIHKLLKIITVKLNIHNFTSKILSHKSRSRPPLASRFFGC